eukprot:330785-Chlamydomonas_euryale.AAC.2
MHVCVEAHAPPSGRPNARAETRWLLKCRRRGRPSPPSPSCERAGAWQSRSAPIPSHVRRRPCQSASSPQCRSPAGGQTRGKGHMRQ